MKKYIGVLVVWISLSDVQHHALAGCSGTERISGRCDVMKWERPVGMKKFGVYGFGWRGRLMRDFLGDDAVAIVDGTPSKIGKLYHGVDIISLEEYANRFAGVPIVVTPTYGIDNLLAAFKKYGIVNYFMLSASPDMYCKFSREKVMSYLMDKVGPQNEVWLFGANFLHVLFGLYLIQKGIKVHIIFSEEENEPHRLMCRREFSMFYYDDLADVPEGEVVMFSKSADEELLNKKGAKCHRIYSVDDLLRMEASAEVTALHNMYADRRCFVIASGPSLRMQDLDKLHENHEICISMNSIYKAYPHTKWRPDFYVVSDSKFEMAFSDVIDDMDVPYKVITDLSPEFWEKEHPSLIKVSNLWSDEGNPFSGDLSLGAYARGTVMYTCLQLAAYIGCKEIYLLGVDFSFDDERVTADGVKDIKHFMDDDENDKIISSRDDSAFINEIYTNKKIARRALEGYIAAKAYADSHGIHFYNATRGGMLEVFERRDFDALFK